MFDNEQEYLNHIDSIHSEDNMVTCTTCLDRLHESDTINLGYDERYCRKCVEDGSAVQFITDNEREEDLEQALQKFKEAVIN